MGAGIHLDCPIRLRALKSVALHVDSPRRMAYLQPLVLRRLISGRILIRRDVRVSRPTDRAALVGAGLNVGEGGKTPRAPPGLAPARSRPAALADTHHQRDTNAFLVTQRAALK